MYYQVNWAPEKWWLIFKVLVLNAVLVAMTIDILYLLGDLELVDYQTSHPQFFWPIEKFLPFVEKEMIPGLILEEIFYRGPIWFLSATGLIFYLGKIRFHPFLIWLAILIPDYLWAMTHSPAKLPIFITGISLGWLVYQTKSLWPAIVVHFISNLGIYLAIKIASLFIKI